MSVVDSGPDKPGCKETHILGITEERGMTKEGYAGSEFFSLICVE